MSKIAHPTERNNTRTTPFGAISGQGRHSGRDTVEHRDPTPHPRRAVYTRVVAIDDGRIGVALSAGELDKPNQHVLHLSLHSRRAKIILADGAIQPRHRLSDLNAEESEVVENGNTASVCGQP